MSKEKTKTTKKYVLFAFITIILSLILTISIVETFFHFHQKSKKTTTNQAGKGLDYGDVVRGSEIGPGGYLKENFNEEVINGYGGTVNWINNSQGFRSDHDFTKTPEPGVLRILSLGDSFTVGYRVGQGTTYSDLLEDWISKNIISSEILLSDIESPYNGLLYFKKYGFTWKPHIVLLGVTLGNDVFQDYKSLNPEKIKFRNGLDKYDLPERCLNKNLKNSSDTGRKVSDFLRSLHIYNLLFPPSYPIVSWYGATQKPKLFDGSTGLGIFIKDPPEIIEEAYRRHFQVLLNFKRFSDSQGIEFAVLVFPQRFQIQSGDWDATVKHYSLNKNEFDLQMPNKRIREFCFQENILCIDSTEFMKNTHNNKQINLYLPLGDMHWNQNGHRYWFLGAKQYFTSLIRSTIEKNRIIRPIKAG